MIYYINVTSWNLLESFVTESLSPHLFYQERSFGNNLSRFFDRNNELSNFLVLSTREMKGDYSIRVDESLIDKTNLSPIKGYSSFFTYNETIFFRKNHVAFRFATDDLKNSFIAEAHILLEVKCIEKYQDSFIVESVQTHAVDVSSKLADANVLSFTLNESVRMDNLFNFIKGAVISYARGILTTSNSAEQVLKSSMISLKNQFAGLNTTIMISEKPVNDSDVIISKILACQSIYNKLRNVSTNQFDILLQHFQEIVKLSKLRSDSISEEEKNRKKIRIDQLSLDRVNLESQIYQMELSGNILSLKEELQSIMDQEKMNGLAVGQKRKFFKAGTPEKARKDLLKAEIKSYEDSHYEYKELLNQLDRINLEIKDLSSNGTIYDNVIQGVFARISDIMNDLIQKVNDTEELNEVNLDAIEVKPEGALIVKIENASLAECEYFNTVLSYLMKNNHYETLSDALILEIIVETAKLYKHQPSSETSEGKTILKCLRDFWCYKNQRSSSFIIPENLPVFQSIMTFYIKPFGFDQIERYMLNKKYTLKAYAFMLWGACLGFAALPKTFTNILYQDDKLTEKLDLFLQKVNNQLRA